MAGSTTQTRRSLRLRDYDYAQPGAYFVTVCIQGGAELLGRIADGKIEESVFGRIARALRLEMPTRFTHVKLDEFVIMPDHVHGIIVLEEVGAGLPRPPGGAAAQKGAETAPVRHTNDPSASGFVGAGLPRPPGGAAAQKGAETAPVRHTNDPSASGFVGAGLPRPPGGAAAQKGAETAPVRTTLGQVVAYFKYQTSKKFNVQRGKPGQRVWQRNYYEHIIRNEDDLRRTREYIRNNPDARAFNTIGRQT